MSPHEYLAYYRTMEAKATKQMVALNEGLEKHSAEECLEYFRRIRYHYEAVCAEAKP